MLRALRHGSHRSSVSPTPTSTPSPAGLAAGVVVFDGSTAARDTADVPRGVPLTPEQIADAVRACLKHAPADKLVFAPDCGLSQTARWAAKKKLASMCAGVGIVRNELGF